MIKVADFVVKFLQEKKIEDVFILPGGGCMHLAVSLFQSELNSISVHHEMAATIGAEAYAKFKNEPAAVFLTTGPGVTHSLTGVAEAFIGATPLFIISGQAKTNQTVAFKNIEGLRQVGVQEIHTVKLVESLTKYAVMITDPNDILYHLEKAYYLARHARPGPVWLDIPIDVQAAFVDETSLRGYQSDVSSEFRVKKETAQEIAALFKKAKNPVIIAGNGVRIANACHELEKIGQAYKIPIVTSLQGIDILPTDHPNNLGNIGHKGARCANMVLQKADLVLAVGSRLTTAATGYAYDLFADKATKIIVDIDRAEHQKNTLTYDLFVHSDAKEFLNLFAAEMHRGKIPSFAPWLCECAAIKKNFSFIPASEEYEDGLDLYYVFEQITGALPPDTHLVADTGSSLFVAMQKAALQKGQRLITSGFASMGYTLPAAIGVSFAAQKGKVVAFNGDGAFAQNVQELQTLKKYRLPVKVILINNSGYFTMKESIPRGNNTDIIYNHLKENLSFPDYELLAKAHGLDYCAINKAADFSAAAYRQIMASDLPALINVKISNQVKIAGVLNFHNADGTFRISPLEDMYPFLDEEELKAVMGDKHHARNINR